MTARDGFRAQTLEGGGVGGGGGGGGVRAKSVWFRAKTVRLPGFRLMGAYGGGGGGVGGGMGRRSSEGADVDVGSNGAGRGGGGAGGEGGGEREGGKGRVDLLAWKPLLFQTNSLPRCCILL